MESAVATQRKTHVLFLLTMWLVTPLNITERERTVFNTNVQLLKGTETEKFAGCKMVVFPFVVKYV
jgi:hypothetical protein